MTITFQSSITHHQHHQDTLPLLLKQKKKRKIDSIRFVGGHFSDEGSLRPSSRDEEAKEEAEENEVTLVTSWPSAVIQNQNRLQGQYCLLSFRPLLPIAIEGHHSIHGLNQKIQYLMAPYTDSLELNNKSLNSQVIYSRKVTKTNPELFVQIFRPHLESLEKVCRFD